MITIKTIPTISLPIGQYDRVSVIDVAVNEIEDIPENNRGKCHTAPILAQTIDAEAFGDKGWIDSKEKAISQACKSGDEAKDMRVFDTGAADLGYKEDAAGDKKAPEPRHTECSYYDVRANAW